MNDPISPTPCQISLILIMPEIIVKDYQVRKEIRVYECLTHKHAFSSRSGVIPSQCWIAEFEHKMEQQK